MRKEYQKPTTQVIRLATTAMVCGSINSTSLDDLSVDNNGTDEGDITTGNARGYSLWDDDEDDY
jgi:hypothetical protein